MTLTTEQINSWVSSTSTKNEAKQQISQIIAQHLDGTFPVLAAEVKEAFAAFICSNEVAKNEELFQLCLELLRIILRDRSTADSESFIPVLQLLLATTALDTQQKAATKVEVMLEAEKCLVNLLFNSAKTRAVFKNQPFEKLLARISAVDQFLGGESQLVNYQYLNGWTQSQLEELFLYDLKIAFVVTAQVQKLQAECINDVDKTLIFQKVMNSSLEKIEAMDGKAAVLQSTLPWKYLNEALKILFNFYHKAKLFDLGIAQLCANDCSQIVQSSRLDAETKQNAVNLLAVMPAALPTLCPELDLKQLKSNKGPIQEGCDMQFVDALLRTFEQQIDQAEEGYTLSEHLAMFLTALNLLCTEHKAARRFCRLKVIPPLTAQDVERRPDVGAAFRNKLIRLMKNTSRCGELAAEFLFVLCKRSVGRLIKYCGFGHSAGLLANYGFLGQALAPKHPSDSEDSQTEEYKQIEEKINPVTGHIPPPEQLEEFQRQLDAMSEEQKEYEMMKLVNAMDKLMDQGVIAPGTIGEDGRPRQVKHVAELIKDVKEENADNEGSDSD